MSNEQQIWAKIVAQAWNDEAFKQKLLDHPEEVFKEFGIEVPAGTHLHVHANATNEVHFALPAKPAGALSEEKLKQIAAGSTMDWGISA